MTTIKLFIVVIIPELLMTTTATISNKVLEIHESTATAYVYGRMSPKIGPASVI